MRGWGLILVGRLGGERGQAAAMEDTIHRTWRGGAAAAAAAAAGDERLSTSASPVVSRYAP